MVSPRLKFALLIAVCCLFAFSANCQMCLDDYCFLTTKYKDNISTDLDEGYRAFLVETSIKSTDLEALEVFLKSEPNERISLLVKGESAIQMDELAQAGLQNLLYSPDKADTLLGVIVTPEDQFFVFSDNQEVFLPNAINTSEYLVSSDSLSSVYTTEDPNNYLTHLRLTNTSTTFNGKKAIENLIQVHGRLPNFLETDQPVIYKSIIDSLNRIKKFKAIVVKDGVYLDRVSWQQLPKLKSCGKLHVFTRNISPTKRGYRFSPDVSNFSPVNENVIKIFYAHYQDPNQGLVMNLDFDNNIINQIRPEDKYLYGFVDYAKDPDRGVYSQFNGESNYIDFGIPSSMDFQEITVSAWIKPDTLTGARSLVGIGNVFSAKLHDGKPTFTTPAIRDHQADSVIVDKNEWQHVAYVYNANNDMSFYYNGQLVERQPASSITIKSHSLLIGSNLWSEYFKGGIDDLYIWNRVLTDDEIDRVFRKDLTKKKSGFSVMQYAMLLMVLMVSIIGFIAWKRKSSGKAEGVEQPHPVLPSSEEDSILPGIYLFGGFRLINKDGQDLASQFSPKRKELFVLVLLYTFRKNGITSKQMSEILWEGHSFESAKNNRSTQMKRIREILSDNTGVSIDYDTKSWQIKIDEGVRWDFSDYSFFKSELDRSYDSQSMESNINGLLSVINQGVLLPNMHYEWLDPIKGQLSEEIIETLTPLLEKSDAVLHTDLKLKISNSIFSLDPLNEKALKFKIKLLVAEGNHTLAKNAFDQFCHSYSHFYGENYSHEFSSFL